LFPAPHHNWSIKFEDGEAEYTLCELVILVETTFSCLFLAFGHDVHRAWLAAGKAPWARKISIARGEKLFPIKLNETHFYYPTIMMSFPTSSTPLLNPRVGFPGPILLWRAGAIIGSFHLFGLF
jgi:hypothetical protein